MSANPCPCEAELLMALASGTWPEAAGRELRDHVSACDGCSELAVVADAINRDRQATDMDAAPPASGAIWWRIQMRMEREAREAAARTVRRTHSAIVVATVGTIVGVLGTMSLVDDAWRWFSGSMPRLSELAAMQLPVPSTTMLLVAAAGLLVITPVIVWLAVAEE